MKKILALVSLLILAAACATQPSGNKDMPANANNAKNRQTQKQLPLFLRLTLSPRKKLLGI
ncbi:MAG TPA: hypothetical protein DC054_05280 [Blastocatellia bacterium]|nr:hypothetical protein [Blastocatellia bacterium]